MAERDTFSSESGVALPQVRSSSDKAVRTTITFVATEASKRDKSRVDPHPFAARPFESSMSPLLPGPSNLEG